MRSLLAVLAFLLTMATPAWADRFSLSYSGYGLGLVPLGSLTVDANVSEESYEVTATIQSGGLLNLFERTRLTATSNGVILGDRVLWRSYDLDHHYSHKHRTIAMRLGEDGDVAAAIAPSYRLWGEPPASEAQRRQSRDPVSTMVAMAIDVGQTRRCAGAYPTFDGRFYYVMELAGGRIRDFDDAGFEGQALRCELAYIAVAGFEREDRGRRRIPHGEVWFALMPDTNFAPPVRITTPLSAGGAVIRLRRFSRAQVNVDYTSASVTAAPSQPTP